MHAGFYYAPGSLKARFCREGNAATLAFSHEHGLPVGQCGKLIVATNDVEVSRLDALQVRCVENGLAPERLDGAALRRAEPRIVGKSAILRDLAVEAELALDRDGKFIAMRGSNIANVGACPISYGLLAKGVEIMSSIYHVPAVHFRARAAITNTLPTRPYRSSGRPEVMFVMERLIDLAARQYGFDRLELRRRNLVPESAMPYRNPFGMVYDSGAYHNVMERAVALGDWAGFPARRAEARARGKYRGIGVSNYVDTATGTPRERAEITVLPDGVVEVVVGTVSNGQGHETSFAQLIGEWLGVPIDTVAARRPIALFQHRAQRSPDPHSPARDPVGRRRRKDPGARRRDQCDCRCARRVWRDSHRDAGHPRARLACDTPERLIWIGQDGFVTVAGDGSQQIAPRAVASSAPRAAGLSKPGSSARGSHSSTVVPSPSLLRICTAPPD